VSKNIRDMLIGIILGDAHIKKVGLDKAFITFEQSSKKRPYFEYVYNTAKEAGIVQKPISTYNRTDPRYDSKTESLYFKTENLSELRPLADSFLNEEGKKIIPSNIGDLLTHRGLAF
jgi:hypothetical protein